MALTPRSASTHNQMITRFITRTKPTTEPAHHDENEPPTKRQKPNPSPSKKRNISKQDTEITPLEIDVEDEIAAAKPDEIEQKTDLESALPPVSTDAEAIEEYEAFKASQEENKANTEERLRDRKWIRGKSSIYVDAFNLALDTVLDEESHLFDEAEMEVFRVWRTLNYEAQYL